MREYRMFEFGLHKDVGLGFNIGMHHGFTITATVAVFSVMFCTKGVRGYWFTNEFKSNKFGS